MLKDAPFVKYSTSFPSTVFLKNCLRGRGDPAKVLVVRIERRLGEELEAWLYDIKMNLQDIGCQGARLTYVVLDRENNSVFPA